MDTTMTLKTSASFDSLTTEIKDLLNQAGLTDNVLERLLDPKNRLVAAGWVPPA